jgi:hypothetical protein
VYYAIDCLVAGVAICPGAAAGPLGPWSMFDAYNSGALLNHSQAIVKPRLSNNALFDIAVA